MKKKFLIALGALILLTGCSKIPKLQDGKEIVASIDGYDLTAEDLYEKLKENGAGIVINQIDEAIIKKEIKDNKNASEYANRTIKQIKENATLYKLEFNDDFIKQYYGYNNEAELKEAIEISYNKNEILKNYLSNNLTDEEINEYYNNEIFGEMTVKHILIKPDVSDDATDEAKKEAENKALEKANGLLEQIKNGADFETLAKENSDDTGTASQGGLFANFVKENTDEAFYKASLNLKDGEYTTTPVKSQFGYHIILKVSQKEKPKLDDVIDTVKEKIVDNKLNTDNNLNVTAWDEIRKKYNFVINDDAIKKSYEDVINSYKK